jgi:hypothetical protein
MSITWFWKWWRPSPSRSIPELVIIFAAGDILTILMAITVSFVKPEAAIAAACFAIVQFAQLAQAIADYRRIPPMVRPAPPHPESLEVNGNG